jgi:hypothetical protein
VQSCTSLAIRIHAGHDKIDLAAATDLAGQANRFSLLQRMSQSAIAAAGNTIRVSNISNLTFNCYVHFLRAIGRFFVVL